MERVGTVEAVYLMINIKKTLIKSIGLMLKRMKKKKILSRRKILDFVKGKPFKEKKDILISYFYKQLDKNIKIH